MTPAVLETEHGREHYQRLTAEAERDALCEMVSRLTVLMDKAGLPYEDFESRAAFAIGYYKSVQEMRHNVCTSSKTRS